MDLPLKYLETGTMISISAGLLGPHGIAAFKQTKGLVEDLQEAHDAVVAAKPMAESKTPRAVAVLAQVELQADVRHDHALRALYYLGLASREYALAQDPADQAQADAMTEMLLSLLPKGLDGTRASHAAEVGHAVAAQQKVKGDPALDAALGSLSIGKKTTGRDVFAKYVSLAHALSTAMAAHALAEHDTAKAATPATQLAARNNWIDIVRTIATLLARVGSDKSEALLATIVGPAETASQKARKDRAPAATAGASNASTENASEQETSVDLPAKKV